MEKFWLSNRKCIYVTSEGARKGIILSDYEEVGGPKDGQDYVIIEDSETKKVKHIKIEEVMEVIE